MMTKQPLTEEALCTWMIGAVARLARVEVAQVRDSTSFEDLGLSSLAAVTLAAQLGDAFGVDVDPLVTWDYPTIGEVARAVSGGLVGTRLPG
jgi:acyl carrier protein